MSAGGRVPPEIAGLTRPDRKLLTLYLLTALVTCLATCGLALPFALIGLIPMVIHYRTLAYRFDEEGVGVSVGLLFRRETYLTFDKIQDIHLKRGLLERWLGLGTVEVQTASAGAAAEATLPGLTRYDEVRDFLYRRMRGAREDEEESEGQPGAGAAAGSDEALALLAEIRDEVVRLQRRLEPPAPQQVRLEPPARGGAEGEP